MPAQLGVASCPCAGTVEPVDYSATVQQVVRSLRGDPRHLLSRLAERLGRLSHEQRYEEAADLWERAAALARALDRQRRYDAIRQAGRVHLAIGTASWALLDAGILLAAGTTGDASGQLALWEGLPLPPGGSDVASPDTGSAGVPLPRHLVDEVATIVSWLEARATDVRVINCQVGLAWPSVPLSNFEPRGGATARRGR